MNTFYRNWSSDDSIRTLTEQEKQEYLKSKNK